MPVRSEPQRRGSIVADPKRDEQGPVVSTPMLDLLPISLPVGLWCLASGTCKSAPSLPSTILPRPMPRVPCLELGASGSASTVSGDPIPKPDGLKPLTVPQPHASGSHQVGYPLLDLHTPPAHGPAVRTAEAHPRGETARFFQSLLHGFGHARHFEHIGDFGEASSPLLG